MTRTMSALAWARSLAARYRSHALRVRRANLVPLRPPVARAPVTVVQHMPSYLTRHVTNRTSHRIALRVAPRVSIAIQTRRVTPVPPTGTDGRVARAPRIAGLAAPTMAPTTAPTAAPAAAIRPVAEVPPRLVLRKHPTARSHVDGPPPAPTRFTPVRRVVRAPAAVNERRAAVATHATPPWPDNPTAPGPAEVWPGQTAGARAPVRTWPQPPPAIDIDHVTDQVIKAIDRRAIAYRERRGRA